MSINFFRRSYATFGRAGILIVIVCSLIAALAYHGPDGEAYSPLNHFISELGETGISPLAWVFNLGLIAGGLLLIPFCIGLGLSLPGWLSKVGMVAGLVAALSLAGVGVFSMNNLPPHIFTAMTYFRSGLATVAAFGLAIQTQPPGRMIIDKRVNLASLAAAACFAGFILYASLLPNPGGTGALDPGFRSNRAPIWPLAVVEWSVFFATSLWFGVLSLAGRKSG